MKSFKSYLIEIDKVRGGGKMPDDWDDPVRRTFLDRLLNPQGPKHPADETLSDLAKNLQHGDVDPGIKKRPGTYMTDEEMKKAIRRATKKRNEALRNENIRKALRKLDDQRFKSPEHTPHGTSKTPANQEHLKFLTPEDEKELKKITGQVEKAKKKINIDDILKQKLEKADQDYGEMLKRSGIKPEMPQKGMDKLMADIGNTPDVDEYTEAEKARLNAIRRKIEQAADEFPTKLAQAADIPTPPQTPSTWSRVAGIAKTIAQNPLTRYGSKALGVAAVPLAALGVYGDAQAMADLDTETKFAPYEKGKQEDFGTRWRNFKRMGGM